jgi:hypothetical protein
MKKIGKYTYSKSTRPDIKPGYGNRKTITTKKDVRITYDEQVVLRINKVNLLKIYLHLLIITLVGFYGSVNVTT